MSKSLIRKNQLHPDVNEIVIGALKTGGSQFNIVYTTGNQIISGDKIFRPSTRILISGGSPTSLAVLGHALINHNGGPGYNTPETFEVYESGNYGTYVKVNNPNTGLNSRAGIYLANAGNNVFLFATSNSGGYQLQLSGDQFTNFHIQNTGTRRILISGNRILIGSKSDTSNGAVLQVPNGITFPVTASLCDDPNTLDDYEEGSWVPILTSTPQTGNFRYNINSTNGYYTRIGNTVFIRGKIVVTGANVAPTATTTQLRISGLPYISFSPGAGNGESSVNISYWELSSGVFDLPSFVQHGSKEIHLGKVTGLTTSPPKLTYGDMIRAGFTGLNLVFAGTYLTTESI